MWDRLERNVVAQEYFFHFSPFLLGGGRGGGDGGGGNRELHEEKLRV